MKLGDLRFFFGFCFQLQKFSEFRIQARNVNSDKAYSNDNI
jgi:hypothetical protein